MRLIDFLTATAEREANANLRSIAQGIEIGEPLLGLLERPHRLVQYAAQLLHESGRGRYDREVWGPTAAQRGYEGRTDLGNVQPGDGSKFRGHGPIQVTGRSNHAEFRDWCRENVAADAPDFEDDPESINVDPWEGLTGVWYWHTRNLNKYADQGNVEMVTRRINGGYNGLDDRLKLYTHGALWLLGYRNGPLATRVRGFQGSHGLVQDGIAGPKTRAALHTALAHMAPPLWEGGAGIAAEGDDTAQPQAVDYSDPMVALLEARDTINRLVRLAREHASDEALNQE